MLSLRLIQCIMQSTALTKRDDAHPSVDRDSHAAFCNFCQEIRKQTLQWPKRGSRTGIRERMLQQVM